MKRLPLFDIFLFVCGVILGAYLHGCNCGSKGYESQKSDTVWVVKHDSIMYQPKIDFIEGGHIPDKVDTVTVIQKFYEKVAYSDTVHIGGSIIRIYDTVHQNHLVPRQVFLDQSQPIITNTITIKEQPRTRLFLGASAGWNITDQSLSVGPSLMLENKKHKVLEVGATVNTRGQLSGVASIKIPLSLKKK